MIASYLFSNINDVNKIHTFTLGRPVVDKNLSCQPILCLRDHKDFFEDELEPIKISDLLFEERAVDILTHDRITEIVPRRKQIRILLDTVIKNKEDCFHMFLFILQNHFEAICNGLNNPTFSASRVSVSLGRCSLTYQVSRAQGIKFNIPKCFWTLVFFYINYINIFYVLNLSVFIFFQIIKKPNALQVCVLFS